MLTAIKATVTIIATENTISALRGHVGIEPNEAINIMTIPARTAGRTTKY